MVEVLVLEFARAAQAGDPFAFRFEPQDYLLRSAGGGFQTSELPWNTQLLSDLTAVRLPGCDRAIVQRLGELLRRFLTPLGFAEQEARIVAKSRAGEQVLVTIRAAAAELYALPWELLTEKSSGLPLFALPGVLLRYEWPETQTVPESPQPRPEGGRILLAWSAAGGAVPASEHERAISEACSAGFVPFVQDRDVLARVSCSRLVAALQRQASSGEPVAVLHLLCHGGTTGSTFGLVLDSDDGDEPVVVDAGTLRQLLAPFASQVRLVVLSACDSGNTGALGNQLGSVAQALHRAGFAAVVASRHPLAVSASVQLTQVLYGALLASPQSLEQALMAARTRLQQNPSQLDWASLQLYARSEDGSDSRPLIFRPYRGLLSFQQQHSRFFFGRAQEVTRIQAALHQLQQSGKPRLLIVAGASGSGKSSVVLAGAVPKLQAEAGEKLRCVVLKPGSEPVRTLEAALPKLPTTSPEDQLLLVVDQLEEIFTHVSNPALRTQFVQRLWQLAQQPGVQVLTTLRVDFISECGELVVDAHGLRLDRVAYDEASRIFIAQLAPEQLRATIEGPALAVGLTLEPGLTSRMLEAIGTEAAALPLLQHTLDQLWLKRSSRLLTQASYDAIGQVAGALSQHAETIIQKLDSRDQRTAQDLLVRLVHLSDGVARATRQRMPVERLKPEDPDTAARFMQVLQKSTEGRLLTISEDQQQETVELAHEALIRSWPRLQSWLQQDREMLVALQKLEGPLQQWREYQALLVGDQLHFAEQLARDYPTHFPKEALPLLARSQQAVRMTRLIRLGFSLVIVVGLFIFAGLFFVEQRANIRAQAARQQVMRLLAKTGRDPSSVDLLQAMARLRIELELDPQLALQSIGQALQLEPKNPQLHQDQAEYLLAAGRLTEVFAPVQVALQHETNGQRRVQAALLAWTAARFLPEPAAQATWREQLLTEYRQLPDGSSLPDMAGTTVLLIQKQHQLRPSLPLSKVLKVWALCHQPKSPASPQTLSERLRAGE